MVTDRVALIGVGTEEPNNNGVQFRITDTTGLDVTSQSGFHMIYMNTTFFIVFNYINIFIFTI